MGRPVVITLTVEASSLYAIGTAATKAQIDAHTSIFDDTPGRAPYTGSNEDFTSDVYIGNTVTWQGRTKYPQGVDSGYAIAIKSVVYEPDPDDPNDVSFFTSPLAGQPGRTGNASATIISGVDGKHDVYTVNFSVYATGQNHVDFPIDPKLRGNN